MPTCKCGKDMFLFEDGMYTIVHICPHCKLALQIYKNHYTVRWVEARELNIFIGDDVDVSKPKESIKEQKIGKARK